MKSGLRLNTENQNLSISEKLMIRICIVFVIIIISLFSFSNRASNILEESNYAITQASHKVAEQFSLMNADLDKINSKAKEYEHMIQNVKSLTEIEKNAQNKRIVTKNSIPNMLNKIMELIPREVKIISITNIEDSKQILIEAESAKYEQLGYFSSVLKTENV